MKNRKSFLPSTLDGFALSMWKSIPRSHNHVSRKVRAIISRKNSLSWPQLLVSSFTVEKPATCPVSQSGSPVAHAGAKEDLRKQRDAQASVSLTCFGGVSRRNWPFRALQVSGHHGIVPYMYVFVTAFGQAVCPCENLRPRLKKALGGGGRGGGVGWGEGGGGGRLSDNIASRLPDIWCAAAHGL